MEFGIDTYTLVHLKWLTNKDLLYSTGNSAQCYVAAWMGREFGGEWIHVYVRLNPFTVHLKLSQHCKSATLQYKIKRREKKGKKEELNMSRKQFCFLLTISVYEGLFS